MFRRDGGPALRRARSAPTSSKDHKLPHRKHFAAVRRLADVVADGVLEEVATTSLRRAW